MAASMARVRRCALALVLALACALAGSAAGGTTDGAAGSAGGASNVPLSDPRMLAVTDFMVAELNRRESPAAGERYKHEAGVLSADMRTLHNGNVYHITVMLRGKQGPEVAEGNVFRSKSGGGLTLLRVKVTTASASHLSSGVASGCPTSVAGAVKPALPPSSKEEAAEVNAGDEGMEVEFDAGFLDGIQVESRNSAPAFEANVEQPLRLPTTFDLASVAARRLRSQADLPLQRVGDRQRPASRLRKA